MHLVEDLTFCHFFCPTAMLAAATFFLILYIISRFILEKMGKEPPGPRHLPLIGNLLQLDLKRPHNTLFELSKKYGSVFTVYFGPTKVVVLAGYKTVKEALVNYSEEFGDRSVTPIFEDITQGHGILFANGDSWKEMRRFAISTLKDFGMGKRVIEDKVIEECHHLIQAIESHKGKPFVTVDLLTYAASSIISSLLYGSRFEYDDSQFLDMLRTTNENNRLLGSVGIQFYNTFPWLHHFIANRKLILKYTEGNIRRFKELLNNLKETLNSHMCRGLVDCFLNRKKKDEDSGVEDSHFHESNLIFTVANLFAAGTDTTATTLNWALLLMAKYPQIQDRVQAELWKVIGNRQIRMDDRRNLPYTDAVIHETQRFASILPMSLPHKTSKDVTFQGHFLKKGTIVYPLLMSVLHDESEWESPHTFNPSHFLDKEGQFVKREAFLPFSAGRRLCLGEGLARMQLLLFFSSLLQRFRFTPPPGVGEDDLDLTPGFSFISGPLPHELCASTTLDPPVESIKSA
ncbi:cytochrome P450 2K1-like [Thalassophryne amazonica]|uniref:cytochrome P450 2K1-like n=1 Tax=Thalassophryne amazonica TaxID=390379 RepID=UPI001471C8F4|nr:cytochrome P450 2K1-like [Thalassophryne amazonica]